MTETIMRVHFIQHVPFEGPARIVDWAEARGHTVHGTHVYLGEALPDLSTLELLVVMGGPMSVNDEREHAWLAAEKRFVADAIRSERAVFGVCLGAQLIAAGLGQRVFPGAEQEIGWFPVRRVSVAEAGSEVVSLPLVMVPLHWHGETFDLPPGAARLAETEVCPNQAFQLGDRVVGTQFHLEATPESVSALVEHAAGDLTGGRFQQDPGEIVARAPAAGEATRPVLFAVLDSLAARVAG